MLTEAEKKWLERREKTKENNGYYFCAHSEIQSAAWNTERGWLDVPWVIDTKDTYKDAAEFEARVAVYLAKSPCLTCPDNPQGGCSTRKLNSYGRAHVEACRLKHARLAVEEEMESE